MGCNCYEVFDSTIRFSEVDENYRCLCTFPHNDNGVLDESRVRSLALLGAAVVLLAHEEIEGPVFLPHEIPDWIKDEIDRVVGYKEA